MNRIYLGLTGLCLAACAHTFAASAPKNYATEDTIIITMPDQSKMLIVVKNKEDLKKFNTVNVDSLIQSLGVYLNNNATPGADTTLKVITNGQQGEVVVNVQGGRTPEDMAMIRNRKMLERQLEMLDRQMELLDKQRAMPQQSEAEKSNLSREKENLQKEKENVAKELESLKKEIRNREAGNKNVRIQVSATDENGKTTVTKVGAEDPKKLAKKNKPWYNQFNIDLGFNAFTGTEKEYKNPTNAEVVDYDLKPVGSRYVSLNWVTGSRIGGANSPVRIQSGLEFNFNNFMFDNNVRIANENNQVVFYKDEELNLDKSKLTATYVTVPLMMGLNFKNAKGKDGFSVMAGGYAGYRIGSHTKIKYADEEGDTKKDKARGSYNLQDYQYGLSASIGYRGFNLFTKYNLSELFKENRGPQAQVLSFGISF